MRVKWVLATLASMLPLCAAPAAAPPTLSTSPSHIVLNLGEARDVTLDGDAISVETSKDASLSEDVVQDLALIDRASSAPQPMYGRQPPRPPAANKLHIVFKLTPDSRETLLVIENGYDRMLRYSAAIGSSARVVPTDVCSIRPIFRGVEHWPARLDRIVLTHLKLETCNEQKGVTCE